MRLVKPSSSSNLLTRRKPAKEESFPKLCVFAQFFGSVQLTFCLPLSRYREIGKILLLWYLFRCQHPFKLGGCVTVCLRPFLQIDCVLLLLTKHFSVIQYHFSSFFLHCLNSYGSFRTFLSLDQDVWPKKLRIFFTKICSNRWPLLAMPSRLSVCWALPRLVIFSFSRDHMLPIIPIWVRACFGFGWGKMVVPFFTFTSQK